MPRFSRTKAAALRRSHCGFMKRDSRMRFASTQEIQTSPCRLEQIDNIEDNYDKVDAIYINDSDNEFYDLSIEEDDIIFDVDLTDLNEPEVIFNGFFLMWQYF